MTMKPGKSIWLAVLIGALAATIPLLSQSPAQWQQDIDTLLSLIESHHPMPWARISKEDFLLRKEQLQKNLADWPGEKITVELMKLVASLQDGHSELRIDNQAGFNLWFPVRMEPFHDGVFITACEESHRELPAARVLKLGKVDVQEAYRRIAEITPKDSDWAASRLIANFLANAVILKTLGIIDDEKKLELEVEAEDGTKKTVALASAPWRLRNNWTWNKTVVPTNSKVITIYDDHLRQLPPYLAKMIPSRIPYWFEYYPEKKLLFLQFNQVANWSREPLADFTKRLFKAFDDNLKAIDKFVIDLRFNEGGNGALLIPFVQEFILRRDSLPRGRLYLITGRHTFSAASNFIGKMLQQTQAITVGDVAPGPLNWCSDIMDFNLPNSRLGVRLSTMFWMTGHATDKRGCYPPDCYHPETFKDLVSYADKPLELICAGQAIPLKDILVNSGWQAFKAEFDKKKSLVPDVRSWFPCTPMDLVLTAYFNLLPAKKANDALELLKFNAQLYPDDLRAWSGMAEIAGELDELDLALEACDRLMKMAPQLAETRPAYLALLLRKSFRDNGIKGLSAMFAQLKTANPDEVNENSLNVMGYGLLRKKRVPDAIAVFKLNVTLYSKYANGYDSLGEAYVQAGDTKNAIRAYRKALELDPMMVSAKEALKKLLEKKR